MAASETEVDLLAPKMFWTAEHWRQAAEKAKGEVNLLRLALSDAEEELEYFTNGYKRQYHRDYRVTHRKQKREANKRWLEKKQKQQEESKERAQKRVKQAGRVSL